MTTVEACHAALQDQRDPTNWYCVGINSEKKLEIQGKGEGGLDELRGMFQSLHGDPVVLEALPCRIPFWNWRLLRIS